MVTDTYSCTLSDTAAGVGALVPLIIQLVLKARIGSDYYCIQPHHPTTRNCYLTLTEQTLPPTSSIWQLFIGITYQHTLLERWIIQWNPAVTEKTADNMLLQSIDTLLKILPLHGLLAQVNKAQIGFIITMENDLPGCHSTGLNDTCALGGDSMEGFTTTLVGTAGPLNLKVVYNEHVDRILWETKPTFHVSLPTLSTSAIGKRRLSRLSLSALDEDESSTQSNDGAQPLAIPLSTSPIQYTHHGHSLAYSTCPTTISTHHRRPSLPMQQHHGLAGSYEESLLSGRMSTLQPSKAIWFHAQIGVIGHGHVKSALRCPPHRSVLFPAYFYNGQDCMPDILTRSPPPFVGTMDLTVENDCPSPGYRIPSKGQLQITIKNPSKFLVKLFLVTYDVSAMPRNTKTFLRQKAYTQSSALLKYAVHLQFCRTSKNRVYLYNQVRVVFVNRSLDAKEQLVMVCEGPKEPVYSALA